MLLNLDGTKTKKKFWEVLRGFVSGIPKGESALLEADLSENVGQNRDLDMGSALKEGKRYLNLQALF